MSPRMIGDLRRIEAEGLGPAGRAAYHLLFTARRFAVSLRPGVHAGGMRRY